MTAARLESAIAFTSISKAYGRVKALDDVSFSVEPGQIVGLLGPNGAGKSTLFQIATGLVAPDKGEVRVHGKSFEDDMPSILREIGVVFQARSIDLDMTVRANLAFHGRLFGLSGAALRHRIEEVAGFLEIAALLDTLVRTLSGGNQRRVEIARALLNRPRLLLLDEPTVGLDTASRRRFVSYARRIRDQEGAAILWTTHLVDEVEDADRIVMIANGRVILDDSPAAVIAASNAATLTDAYMLLARPDDREAGNPPD